MCIIDNACEANSRSKFYKPAVILSSEIHVTGVNLNTRSHRTLCDNLQLAAVITSCPRVQSTTVQDLRQRLASEVLANIDLAMQGTVMLQNN